MARVLKYKVLVILGQTASGKSDLAVKLAKKLNGEIISADSRQVYRGLNIGSGKITKREMRGVPHHLLDVVRPKNKFTVTEFKKLADKKIKEIIARGKIPIICGGTGFYIDAVVNNSVFPDVKPNLKLRKKLATFSAIALFVTLQKLDPRRAEDIKNKNEQNNKVRLVRAIEIAKALGRVPKIKTTKSKYEFIKIGIKLPEEILKQRIEKRVKKMFKAGLLQEIRNLKKSEVSKKRLAEFGFEYNEPTPEKVILGTVQYAKRQMTWFKRDPQVVWLSPESVVSFLKKKIPSVKVR